MWAGRGRAERWALPRRGPDLWCGQERPELGPALLLSASRRARQGPMAGGLGPRLLALALALGPAGERRAGRAAGPAPGLGLGLKLESGLGRGLAVTDVARLLVLPHLAHWSLALAVVVS